MAALDQVPSSLVSLREALFRNPWIKLLSVFIALFTWLYVQGEEVREERVKAQIVWLLPQELVATDALPASALITVRGTRAAVNQAHQASVRLLIDARELTVGEHDVDLVGANVDGLPPSVERLALSPPIVRFTLDQVATHSVRVQPVLVGDPSPGFTVASVTVEPNVLELRGSRNALSALREVPTRPIDVSGLTETLVREIQLDLPRAVDLSSPVTLRATVEVSAQNERRRVEGVNVYVFGNLGASVSPSQVVVTLEGAGARLREVSPEKIAAFVHWDGAGAGTEVWLGPGHGPRVEVLHPFEGVRVVSMSPSSVTVKGP